METDLSSHRQSGNEYGYKKRELIGKLYREGQLYTREAVEVYDHDWASLAAGVAISHGLYDLGDNVGYIQIGTSHDTSEFACDSINFIGNKALNSNKPTESQLEGTLAAHRSQQ